MKGEVKVQTDGAPIGLDLSGEIGRLETAKSNIAIAKLNTSKITVVANEVMGRMLRSDMMQQFIIHLSQGTKSSRLPI